MPHEEKLFLCSGDGHVGAPTERYKEFLERRLRIRLASGGS